MSSHALDILSLDIQQMSPPLSLLSPRVSGQPRQEVETATLPAGPLPQWRPLVLISQTIGLFYSSACAFYHSLQEISVGRLDMLRYKLSCRYVIIKMYLRLSICLLC